MVVRVSHFSIIVLVQIFYFFCVFCLLFFCIFFKYSFILLNNTAELKKLTPKTKTKKKDIIKTNNLQKNQSLFESDAAESLDSSPRLMISLSKLIDHSSWLFPP